MPPCAQAVRLAVEAGGDRAGRRVAAAVSAARQKVHGAVAGGIEAQLPAALAAGVDGALQASHGRRRHSALRTAARGSTTTFHDRIIHATSEGPGI
jgi:hypothetical protein